MATKIIPKKSSVIDKVPLTTDLDVGEIAINLADKKLYTKDSSETIISLGNTEETRIPIKADVALAKGDLVYATGAVGASGKITVNKFIANNTIEEIYVVGVADRDFAIGDVGYALSLGEVKELNTTGTTVGETWVDGTVLYSSPTTAGKLTSVRPQAPNQDISVAIVIRAHATTGLLFVRPLLGYHLDELHDVYAPAPTNGQVLAWNSTTLRWEAATFAGGYTDADVDTHLNTSTAASGEVLSWNGTDYDWIAAGGGGGGASIATSDTPPTSPSDGDLWFNTTDASLNVYYEDGDSGQWVVTSGVQGPAYEVLVSSTPPATAESGDLWFNTNDASMYFYYDDGTSTNWIAISGPAGAAGADGADGVTTGKAIAMAIVFG
jgi:hypothetical protein